MFRKDSKKTLRMSSSERMEHESNVEKNRCTSPFQSVRSPESNYKVPFQHSRIKTPGKEDVLLGRGRSSDSHPGNIAYQATICEATSAYLTLVARAEKTRLTTEIVKSVKIRGGRFLEKPRNSEYWTEVADEKGTFSCCLK